MKLPVVHNLCDGVVGYFTGETDARGFRMAESRTFERIDGSHPKYGSDFNEVCPKCKKKITSNSELSTADMPITV